MADENSIPAQPTHEASPSATESMPGRVRRWLTWLDQAISVNNPWFMFVVSFTLLVVIVAVTQFLRVTVIDQLDRDTQQTSSEQWSPHSR